MLQGQNVQYKQKYRVAKWQFIYQILITIFTYACKMRTSILVDQAKEILEFSCHFLGQGVWSMVVCLHSCGWKIPIHPETVTWFRYKVMARIGWALPFTTDLFTYWDLHTVNHVHCSYGHYSMLWFLGPSLGYLPCKWRREKWVQ